MSEQEPEQENALDRLLEVGDVSVEGEVPESDPYLPAVDEDELGEDPTETLDPPVTEVVITDEEVTVTRTGSDPETL